MKRRAVIGSGTVKRETNSNFEGPDCTRRLIHSSALRQIRKGSSA